MSPPQTRPATQEGPLFAYRTRRRAGVLNPDQSQELAAEKLQSLHNALRHYRVRGGKGGWKERLGLVGEASAVPLGLYIYGGVGRGKSMLMDLFFEAAPTAPKRRVHFHEFMIEVQRRLHEGRRQRAEDPLAKVAGAMAGEATLLCFDEFHVVNIADAMILGRLFAALFEAGVVVVATSNWGPDDLYKDGLQRERFLPFIALVKQRLDVLHLEAGADWRLDRLRGETVYYLHPLGEPAERALGEIFARLTDEATGEPTMIDVGAGRTLTLPRAARGVVWADFTSLCAQPLGAADYLALAKAFHTLILSGVPQLGPERHNEARRFMILVDALYEHKTNLVASAERPPHTLYPQGQGAVEFERTVSRLVEMQSLDYIETPHRAALGG